MNLKAKPEVVDKLIERSGFYRAYHMNKRRMFSIVLDNGVDLEDIFRFILLKFCISIFANKWLSDAVQHRICCLKINFFTEFLNGIKLG